MDDEDEIDILGDFDLENLLTRRDRTQASYSLSSNDNYSLPSSDWILENASPLFNVKSVLTGDQVIYDNPCPFPPIESSEVNPNIWTEKERTLLDRGLELFGKSHTRLSQYIGTKNPSQVKSYLRTYPSTCLTSASSSNSLNNVDENELDTIEVVDESELDTIDSIEVADESELDTIEVVDENELDTIEVIVSTVDNPSVAPSPSNSLSTLSDDYLDSLGSDSDSYMGSTTSAASESDRPIQQEFSLQPFYQESSQVQSPPTKPKKLFVKKKPKPAPLSDDDSDDSVDYDNTNIIFKPRKLSKYHLMVKAGDQVLPTGEQVIRIKKEEARSDTDVDVLESDDETFIQIHSTKPHRVDVDSFDPNRGMKISRVVQPKQRAVQFKEKKPLFNVNPNPDPIEDTNEEIEVDVVDDLMDGNNTDMANAISSCIPIPDEDSDCNERKPSKKSKTIKRLSVTKYDKSKKKSRPMSGRASSTSSRNVNIINRSNTSSRNVNSINRSNTSSRNVNKASTNSRNANIVNKARTSSRNVNIVNKARTSSRNVNKPSTNSRNVNKANTSSRNVNSLNKNSNTVSMLSKNRNVYLNKSDVNNSPSKLVVDCNENKTIPESNISVNDIQPDTKCTENRTNSKASSKETIVITDSDFRSERHKLIHVDDLLANYDFSNVRLLDHNTQMMRISQLRPVDMPSGDDKTNSKHISIEEIDYHRDFFLHNDAFFINRFLRIRNHILREWSCKRPKYINKAAIRSGLKHCGTMVLIARIHSYLEQKGHINK